MNVTIRMADVTGDRREPVPVSSVSTRSSADLKRYLARQMREQGDSVTVIAKPLRCSAPTVYRYLAA